MLWATIWAKILELGMTGPPMARMVGLFVAHLVFGVAMGLLIQHFLQEEDPGGLLAFLGGRRA